MRPELHVGAGEGRARAGGRAGGGAHRGRRAAVRGARAPRPPPRAREGISFKLFETLL